MATTLYVCDCLWLLNDCPNVWVYKSGCLVGDRGLMRCCSWAWWMMFHTWHCSSSAAHLRCSGLCCLICVVSRWGADVMSSQLTDLCELLFHQCGNWNNYAASQITWCRDCPLSFACLCLVLSNKVTLLAEFKGQQTTTNYFDTSFKWSEALNDCLTRFRGWTADGHQFRI